jgi:putative transposase
LKEPLLVKYDPRNLSRVYVQDPSGRHWPVPYADLRQPPIALWEMEAVNKQARQDGRKMNSEEAIFANIIAQRQLIQKASSLSKQRRQQEKFPRSAEPSPNSNSLKFPAFKCSPTAVTDRARAAYTCTAECPYCTGVWDITSPTGPARILVTESAERNVF